MTPTVTTIDINKRVLQLLTSPRCGFHAHALSLCDVTVTLKTYSHALTCCLEFRWPGRAGRDCRLSSYTSLLLIALCCVVLWQPAPLLNGANVLCRACVTSECGRHLIARLSSVRRRRDENKACLPPGNTCFEIRNFYVYKLAECL